MEIEVSSMLHKSDCESPSYSFDTIFKILLNDTFIDRFDRCMRILIIDYRKLILRDKTMAVFIQSVLLQKCDSESVQSVHRMPIEAR